MAACIGGNYEIAKIFSEYEDGNTPLMIACERGCFSSSQKLLERSEIHDINLKNKNGQTALMQACGNWKGEDNFEFISYLFDNFKIDIDEVDQWK